MLDCSSGFKLKLSLSKKEVTPYNICILIWEEGENTRKWQTENAPLKKKTICCKSAFETLFPFIFQLSASFVFWIFKAVSRKTLENIRSDVIRKRALVLCIVDYRNGHSKPGVSDAKYRTRGKSSIFFAGKPIALQ